LARGDLRRREIDADEAALRQRDGHRQQVAAAGATELQDTAAIHRGRAHPRQRRDHGKMIWMGHPQGVAVVGDVVIAAGRGVAHGASPGTPIGRSDEVTPYRAPPRRRTARSTNSTWETRGAWPRDATVACARAGSRPPDARSSACRPPRVSASFRTTT